MDRSKLLVFQMKEPKPKFLCRACGVLREAEEMYSTLPLNWVSIKVIQQTDKFHKEEAMLQFCDSCGERVLDAVDSTIAELIKPKDTVPVHDVVLIGGLDNLRKQAVSLAEATSAVNKEAGQQLEEAPSPVPVTLEQGPKDVTDEVPF